MDPIDYVRKKKVKGKNLHRAILGIGGIVLSFFAFENDEVANYTDNIKNIFF